MSAEGLAEKSDNYGTKTAKIRGPPLWRAPPFTPWISWSIREYPGAKVILYFRKSKYFQRSQIKSSISALRSTPARRRSLASSLACSDTEKDTGTFFAPGGRHFRPAPGLAPPRLISVVCIFHSFFKSVLGVKYLHPAAIAIRSASHRDMQVRSIISAALKAIPIGVVFASHPVLHPFQWLSR